MINFLSAIRDKFHSTKNSFGCEDISAVKAKYGQLTDQPDKPLACIIWAPAFPFYKDILKDFAEYGEISNVKKRSYSKRDFEKAVRAIYAVDDIAKWKVDTKLKFFRKYENSLITFDLLLHCPDYRINAAGTPVSATGTEAKRTIRQKHQNKVKDYIYDVVLHTCDNPCQSEYMQNIFDAGHTEFLDETVSV